MGGSGRERGHRNRVMLVPDREPVSDGRARMVFLYEEGNMSLFRRHSSDSRAVQTPPSPPRPDVRLQVDARRSQATLLDGEDDLRVAGTSHYQENLWRLAGKKSGGERAQRAVTALLVAEDANSYDRNAIAVWIDGLQVGHLS